MNKHKLEIRNIGRNKLYIFNLIRKLADIIYSKNKITDFLSKLIEHTTK